MENYNCNTDSVITSLAVTDPLLLQREGNALIQ